MSTVSNEIFEGFCKVVFNGEIMYSLPPAPPLPVTKTLLKEAVPPNEPIPVVKRLIERLDFMAEVITFQMRGYIDGDGRNGHISNSGPSHNVCLPTQVNRQLSGQSNTSEELGKSGIVQRPKRYVCERDR